MIKQIFVNLPVEDVNKSKDFFVKLGFEINNQFSNSEAACIVMSDNIYTMLLSKSFFKTFTPKNIIDAHSNVEVINAISVASRAEVDTLVTTAFAAGATSFRDKDDHGWMYSWSFQDLDHHVWEVMWSDISQLNGQKASEV